jgi:hypothetical protein
MTCRDTLMMKTMTASLHLQRTFRLARRKRSPGGARVRHGLASTPTQ